MPFLETNRFQSNTEAGKEFLAACDMNKCFWHYDINRGAGTDHWLALNDNNYDGGKHKE